MAGEKFGGKNFVRKIISQKKIRLEKLLYEYFGGEMIRHRKFFSGTKGLANTFLSLRIKKMYFSEL